MGYGLVRRVGMVAALVATATALGVTAANAQPVTSGSLSFTGDPGDYISGGATFSYATSANDVFSVFSDNTDNHVTVEVSGANADFWELDMAAPSGQALAAGSYSEATRYPFQAPSAPGLDLAGNGRGCNMVTGSFVVQDAVFGPQGYVQTFDATYEQQCDGSTATLRGEVHIANPPAPPVLGVGLTVSTDGTASKLDGNATISGEVTCTDPVSVGLSGQVTQVAHRTIIRGNYSTSVACTPDAPVAWSAVAVPTGTTPFQRGQVEVQTTASAVDPTYGNTVSVSQTTVVTLTSVDSPS